MKKNVLAFLMSVFAFVSTFAQSSYSSSKSAEFTSANMVNSANIIDGNFHCTINNEVTMDINFNGVAINNKKETNGLVIATNGKNVSLSFKCTSGYTIDKVIINWYNTNYSITSGTLSPNENNESYDGNNIVSGSKFVNEFSLTGTNSSRISVKSAIVYYTKCENTLDFEDDSYTYADDGIEAYSASYTRTMNSQWGTICLPFDVEQKEDNQFDLYTISDASNLTGGALTLTKLNDGEKLSAGNSAIIRRNAEVGQVTLDAAVPTGGIVKFIKQSDIPTDELMEGTFKQVVFNDQAGENKSVLFISKNMFWNTFDGEGNYDKVTINPFRAWIKPSTSEAFIRQLSIWDPENNVSTGVDINETVDMLNDSAAEYYDISGKKLSQLQKGLNIVKTSKGTRKVYIK